MNTTLPPSTVKDLHDALEQPGAFRMGQKLINMFISDKDPKSERSNRLGTRFNTARELYKGARDSHSKKAVFYRIDDLKSMTEEYKKANSQTVKDYVSQVGLNPDLYQIKDFFEKLKSDLEVKQTLTSEEENKLFLVKDWLASNDFSQLQTSNIFEVFGWFDKKVTASAKKAFYQVDDIEKAMKKGIIYGPGDEHNWGVNVAWAIAITQKQVRIYFLSDLDTKNLDRSDVRAAFKHENNPSAFSLETAIALKAGYTLTCTNDKKAQLEPPLQKPDISIFSTNGIPGNGILPTKKQQTFLFNQCILASSLVKMNPVDLNNYIDQICSGTDNKQKLNLAVALNLMNKDTTLIPLLKKLEQQQSKQLEMLQNDRDFSSAVHMTKMSAFDLAKHIGQVLSSNETNEQLNLISALNLMDKNAFLTPLFKKLEPEQLKKLNTLLSEKELPLEFDNIKSAAGNVFLAINLLETANEDVSELNDYIDQVHSKNDDDEKLNLASALNLMNKKNYLIPLLKELAPEQLEKLHIILSDQKFSTGFGKVKSAINNISLAKNLKEMDIHSSKNHINQVCLGNNSSQQLNLVSALNLMRKDKTLASLLKQLEPQQLSQLDDLLSDKKFSSGFEKLKSAIKNIPLTVQLETMNTPTLNNYIDQICSGSEDNKKLNLATALNLIEDTNLMLFLKQLEPQQLEKLNTLFSEAKFSSGFEIVKHFSQAVTLEKMGEVNLNHHIEQACSSNDEDEQSDLMIALSLIQENGTLDPLLKKLDKQQIENLKSLLSKEDFSERFAEVKSELESNFPTLTSSPSSPILTQYSHGLKQEKKKEQESPEVSQQITPSIKKSGHHH